MRVTSSRYQNHQADEENPYWISFSDIMAGLLVIFVLAAVALVLELTQLKEQVQQDMSDLARAEQVRKELLREIEQQLNSMNIPVTISDNDTVLRIPEDVLTFRQGSFDIPSDKQHQAIAMDIGRVLYRTISKDQRWQYLDTIFVEGHTDRVPYRNRLIKGNWGLSTFRAISVWNYWNNTMPAGERLEELYNHTGKRLFSVSGYAETRPTPCTNEDPNINNAALCPNGLLAEDESLRKNRRIDIRFTVKRPAVEDYQVIKQALH